jgi:tetratricopeptide (TPR) repeat protein
VAYESQVAIALQQAHLSIAEVLEQEYQDQPSSYGFAEAEQLAYHLYEARRISEAVNELVKAIEILVKRSAHTETIALCAQAVAWLAELPASVARDEREFALRQTWVTNLVAVESFGSAGVGEQLELISTLLKTVQPKDEMFPSMFVYSTYYIMRGDADGSMLMASQLAEKAEQLKNNKWIIVASSFLGMQLFTRGQFSEAVHVLKRALSLCGHNEHDQLAYEFGMDSWRAVS